MRFVRLFALVTLLAMHAPHASPMEVEEVTLAATHRVYKNFREEQTVKLGERFFIGDTEFTAEAAEFLPDFAIDLEAGKIFSRSDEPNNPAVRVIIFENGEKIDEVWAFKGKGAPHFSRTSLIAFELLNFKAVASPSTTETGDRDMTEDAQADGNEPVEGKEGSTE